MDSFKTFFFFWHFDKFREDAEGEYVKIVGRFEGDWANEIELARKRRAKPYNEQRYEHANKKSTNLQKKIKRTDGKPDAYVS